MPASRRITKSHYELLAGLRYALRRFLHFSEDAARTAGLKPQQHQALLSIKGFPGRDRVSIGELAERLQVRHHSAVGLVDRAASVGLVDRRTDPDDHRVVRLHLTARGAGRLRQLSGAHLEELRRLAPKMRSLWANLEPAHDAEQ